MLENLKKSTSHFSAMHIEKSLYVIHRLTTYLRQYSALMSTANVTGTGFCKKKNAASQPFNHISKSNRKTKCSTARQHCKNTKFKHVVSIADRCHFLSNEKFCISLQYHNMTSFPTTLLCFIITPEPSWRLLNHTSYK